MATTIDVAHSNHEQKSTTLDEKADHIQLKEDVVVQGAESDSDVKTSEFTWLHAAVAIVRKDHESCIILMLMRYNSL